MIDRTREWKDLPKLCPGFVLREIWKIETGLPLDQLDPTVRALRGRDQKRFLEGRQGCLFCYGMGKKLGVPVLFIQKEGQDYDGIAVWRDGDTENYCPVQLKELVPAQLNPTDTINARLAALAKYTDSSDLVVAIHHTRGGRFEPGQITIPTGIRLAGIYVFAGTSADKKKWVLMGDFTKARGDWWWEDFDYPT